MKLNYIIIVIAMCLTFLSCEKTTKQLDPVATPSFQPSSDTYYSPQSVRINCATSSAVIRYTLDGTNPTSSSQIYSLQIGIANNTTITAQAFKAKMKNSPIAKAIYNFQVANLYIEPISGTYFEPKNVNVYSSTPGTIVHYTTDGSDPSENSPIWTNALIVNRNMVVKAKGFVEGWTPSDIITASYQFKVGKPTFSITEGQYSNSLNVSLSTQTSDAIIRYTTDNSIPTESSAIYTNPLTVSVSTVVKAKAYKDNWNESDLATANYQLKVLPTSYSPQPTTYNSPQIVTINCATPNVKIYYTTNGFTPTNNDNLYTGPLTISSITNLKSVAIKAGWLDSDVTSGDYNFIVATPYFDPPANTYTEEKLVSIKCVTPEVTIRYTTNGFEPTNTSQEYTAPILVSTTTTIKAKAFRAGMNSSLTAAATYTINPIQTVATPVIAPQGGTFNTIKSVVISCATSLAAIRYTIDGNDPSESSLLYTGPVTIAENTTLKAKAFRPGWYSSQIVTEVFTINFESDVMISIQGNTFTMGRTTGSGEADELPPHQVTLSAYLIGKYELIQADWIPVMGSNPSYFTGDLFRPVENVTWYEVLVYCNKRSINEGLNPVYSISNSTNPDNWGVIPTTPNATWDAVICNLTANGYRLPTEAEWEYAARAGTNNPYYVYSGSNNIDEVAWYQSNSGGSTKPVGLLLGNSLSLYDMSGNVSEWCWDWYDPAYYNTSPTEAIINPTGPSAGFYRIHRGGSWENFVATSCRILNRESFTPDTHRQSIGIRLVRSLVSK